jgi:hypothetical protein
MPIQPSHGTQVVASHSSVDFCRRMRRLERLTPSSFDMSEYRQMMERQKEHREALRTPLHRLLR